MRSPGNASGMESFLIHNFIYVREAYCISTSRTDLWILFGKKPKPHPFCKYSNLEKRRKPLSPGLKAKEKKRNGFELYGKRARRGSSTIRHEVVLPLRNRLFKRKPRLLIRKRGIFSMALANTNDTKRSAVNQLYTAFRSVVAQENSPLRSVVQPPLLLMTDAVTGR